jgi:hypothetical protein
MRRRAAHRELSCSLRASPRILARAQSTTGTFLHPAQWLLTPQLVAPCYNPRRIMYVFRERADQLPTEGMSFPSCRWKTVIAEQRLA